MKGFEFFLYSKHYFHLSFVHQQCFKMMMYLHCFMRNSQDVLPMPGKELPDGHHASNFSNRKPRTFNLNLGDTPFDLRTVKYNLTNQHCSAV